MELVRKRLFTSTALNTVVVPVLYDRFGQRAASSGGEALS